MLHRAVDRIAKQLAVADPASRPFLFEELAALQQIGNRFLESWIDFEDKVQDLHDRYEESADAPVTTGTGEYALALNDTEVTLVADENNPLLSSHLSSDIGQTLTHERGERWFRQGIGYFDLLMYKESRIQFEHIVKSDPHMTIARLYLALCLIASDQAQEAQRHLRIVLQTAREPAVRAAAYDAWAQLDVRAGRYKEAMVQLSHTVAIRPDYVDAHVNLAVCAYLARDFKAASLHAQNALAVDNKDVTGWRILGAAAHELGYRQEALAAYTRAHQLAPGFAALMIEAGRVCLAAQQTKLSASWFTRALHSPHKIEALAGLAQVAMRERQYEQAVLLLKKQLCLQPQSPGALFKLAWALVGCLRLDEAERVFHHCEQTLKMGDHTLTGRARIALYRGDLSEAQRLLREAVADKDPKRRAHALAEYGRLHLERRESSLAIRCFQGALALDQNQEDALMGLGVALREQSLGSPDHEPARKVQGADAPSSPGTSN